MDVIYTREEMAFLVEAAEHFRDNAYLYRGSYFEAINPATFVPVCTRLLEAYARASEVELPERPTQEAGWVRIRKLGDAFHVQADDALSDLTNVAIMEFRHHADPQRAALITAIIAKSCPKDDGLEGARLESRQPR